MVFVSTICEQIVCLAVVISGNVKKNGWTYDRTSSHYLYFILPGNKLFSCIYLKDFCVQKIVIASELVLDFKMCLRIKNSKFIKVVFYSLNVTLFFAGSYYSLHLLSNTVLVTKSTSLSFSYFVLFYVCWSIISWSRKIPPLKINYLQQETDKWRSNLL